MEPRRHAAHRRAVALVFQSHNLVDYLTPRENVLLIWSCDQPCRSPKWASTSARTAARMTPRTAERHARRSAQAVFVPLADERPAAALFL